jgi:multisubunit Na+/H+ antiporter MnhF subunit
LAPFLACGPALLAGIAFARMFSAAGHGAKALGWNVIGAMCGGALELLAIGIGNRALNLVALALYVVAFICHVRYLRARSSAPGARSPVGPAVAT